MRNPAGKCGFTLVEIMITVAIIGLLATIAIPSFRNARDQAMTKSCVNNLRQIGWGKEQFIFDNNGTLPATIADLVPTYIKKTPVCPDSGTYTMGAPAVDPTCTVGGGHVL